MFHKTPSHRKFLSVLWLALLIPSAMSTLAQSVDPTAPSPIRSTDLLGRIAARDLGDARLTDHYYAFKGIPGDLLITVQSRNLNGDIDIFTAGTLRPLLKLTLYAENTSPISKGIYLRRREDLILRVEARSPNDDEGTYQLSFGGSFEPIAGGPELAETEDTSASATRPATGSSNKTRRVSSVGARIDEPITEVAAAPTPEPTPEAKPAEPPDNPKETAVTTKSTPSRTARPRRPVSRRTTPAPTTPKEPAVTKKKTEDDNARVATPESKPKASTRGSTRRNETTAGPTNPTPEPSRAEPEPEVGPRLIIETNDGTLINRSMSGVRRVMVENGQVVVVGKDGRVIRFLLANVIRMSIAP
jgi:hypothetical protein